MNQERSLCGEVWDENTGEMRRETDEDYWGRIETEKKMKGMKSNNFMP